MARKTDTDALSAMLKAMERALSGALRMTPEQFARQMRETPKIVDRLRLRALYRKQQREEHADSSDDGNNGSSGEQSAAGTAQRPRRQRPTS